MSPQDIFDRLTKELGEDVVFDLHADPKKDKDPWFQVAPAAIARVGTRLKDDPELACNYLECVTGTDYPTDKKIHVTYHVYSLSKKHRVVIKCFCDRESPSLPTVSTIWSTANWQERECFDLLGVTFEGHPDLRRILLPEDWEGYPLRKDYKEKVRSLGFPRKWGTAVKKPVRNQDTGRYDGGYEMEHWDDHQDAHIVAPSLRVKTKTQEGDG